MKKAGLSIGLLYGTGGGQGQSTTQGGRQEGVDMGTTQAGGISLQGASILADIKLKEAEAEKAEAEAKKTAGADTQYTESLTSLNSTIEQLNKATTALRTALVGKAQEETKEAIKQSKTKQTEKQQQTAQVLIYSTTNNMEPKDLFKIHPISEEQNNFIITIGKHLATTKRFKTRESAENYIKYPKWDTVFALIAEMIELNETAKYEANNEPKEQPNVKSEL